MHVLHAHWHFPTAPTESGGMLFWVEDSEAPTPPKKRGRPGKAARPHPFCAAPESTKQLLSAFDPNTADSQINWITLLLPTTKFGPQPSPQLVHDWEIDHNTAPSLHPWLVAGAWLSPVDAFPLLANLPASEDLPPYLVLGSEVRYWQTVANLALETLAQQKLLPVLAVCIM